MAHLKNGKNLKNAIIIRDVYREERRRQDGNAVIGPSLSHIHNITKCANKRQRVE